MNWRPQRKAPAALTRKAVRAGIAAQSPATPVCVCGGSSSSVTLGEALRRCDVCGVEFVPEAVRGVRRKRDKRNWNEGLDDVGVEE